MDWLKKKGRKKDNQTCGMDQIILKIAPIQKVTNLQIIPDTFKQTSNPAQLMKTVNLMNRYAINKGYGGIGQISSSNQPYYIGRYYDKNTNMVLPLPGASQLSQFAIGLKQNFQYKMQQAINSWNTFIDKQSQLVQFLKAVQNPKKQQQWMRQKIQNLSQTSQLYKWLSSLFYLYVFPHLPVDSFDTDLQKFQVKTNQGPNPLLLSLSQQTKIFQFFIKNNGQPIGEIIMNLKNIIPKPTNFPLKQTILQNFFKIPAQHAQNVSFYLNKYDLSANAINKVLEGGIQGPKNDKINQVKQSILQYIDQNTQGQTADSIRFKFPLNKSNLKQFPTLSQSDYFRFDPTVSNLFSAYKVQGVSVK